MDVSNFRQYTCREYRRGSECKTGWVPIGFPAARSLSRWSCTFWSDLTSQPLKLGYHVNRANRESRSTNSKFLRPTGPTITDSPGELRRLSPRALGLWTILR